MLEINNNKRDVTLAAVTKDEDVSEVVLDDPAMIDLDLLNEPI